MMVECHITLNGKPLCEVRHNYPWASRGEAKHVQCGHKSLAAARRDIEVLKSAATQLGIGLPALDAQRGECPNFEPGGYSCNTAPR